MIPRLLLCTLIPVLAIATVGCGSNESSTVVKPGGAYQPTPEERATMDLIDKDMESRDQARR